MVRNSEYAGICNRRRVEIENPLFEKKKIKKIKKRQGVNKQGQGEPNPQHHKQEEVKSRLGGNQKSKASRERAHRTEVLSWGAQPLLLSLLSLQVLALKFSLLLYLGMWVFI